MSTLELILELKPSRQFMVLNLLIMLSSIVVICVLPVMLLPKILLSLLVLIYSGWIFWTYVFLKNPRSITKIIVSENNWMIGNVKHIFPVRLLGDSTATTWVSVCRFKSNAGKNHGCIIFKDSLDSEDYRRFLVKIRNAKIE